MPKPAKKSKKSAKKAAKPPAKAKAKAPAARSVALDFNHAMIYAKDVARSTGFYSGLLGFKVIDEFRYEGQPVYARLRAKAGNGTIAIHQLSPGAPNASEGVRLYFEVEALDEFCARLKARGIYFTQLPKMMPWGWKHAYLDDPDNHEISLYWAGANRMKKTVMRAGRDAGAKR